MKKLLLFLSLLLPLASGEAVGAETKTYDTPYVEALPRGVSGWLYSGLLKDRRETRFLPYNQASAEHLILDATAERSVTRDPGAAERETAFRAAFDATGIGIYVEAVEPEIRALLDAVVDPASPGHKEALEIFVSPGLSRVPYYQIFVQMLSRKVEFFDWGSPNRDYRTLSGRAEIDIQPLTTGFGVALFIPWEALYDEIPWEGGDWRFSIIRWMPFGKAGGVSWGGRVHETGSFGLLRFPKLTTEQRFLIERRLTRSAWFNFLARSSEANRRWNDEKMGDAPFYQQVLKPVIDEQTDLGQAVGSPDNWTAEVVGKLRPYRKDWLEFSYKVSNLRADYLLKKRFTEVENNLP